MTTYDNICLDMATMHDQDDLRRDLQDNDLTSVREAARLLRVSESTIWRWIKEGSVPSYRVGRKRVYLKAAELARMVKPKQDRQKSDLERLSEMVHLVPMAPGRARKDAVERAAAFRAEMLAKRGGVPFPPAWIDINEMRDERSRDLE
jgi:excisionase family DNA binding protein